MALGQPFDHNAMRPVRQGHRCHLRLRHSTHLASGSTFSPEQCRSPSPLGDEGWGEGGNLNPHDETVALAHERQPRHRRRVARGNDGQAVGHAMVSAGRVQRGRIEGELSTIERVLAGSQRQVRHDKCGECTHRG